MSDLFSVGSNDFFSSYFGGSGGGASSNMLGDFSMIKSGTYTKLMKKYYEENPVQKEDAKKSIKDSKAADTNVDLLSVKNSAKNTVDSAKKLTDSLSNLGDVPLSEDEKGKLLKDVKSFVESYNSMVGGLDNIESVSILQNALWMTKQVSQNANVLASVGIKVGDGNKLSIDEDVFKGAANSAFKSAFVGTHSPVNSIAQRASQIYNTAGAQAILNSRNASYNSNGGYNAVVSNSLINSLM